MLAIVFLLYLTPDASANMKEKPENLVVRVGETIRMSCQWNSHSDWIEWYHKDVGSKTDLKINNRNYIINPVFNGSTLEGDNPGQSLKVLSAKENHAGLYTCSAMIVDSKNEAKEETASAHVIVLTTNPVCEAIGGPTLMENDTFEINCVLSYTGSWTPTIKWWQITESGWKELYGSHSITESRAVSILNGVATVSMHGSRFQSQTFFEIFSMKLDVTANNTPKYNYTWTSPLFQVIYGPRNLIISSSGDTMFPNEQLTCSAEGNPPPTVQWIHLETNYIVNSSIVEVTEEMVRGDPYSFICKATNTATNYSTEQSIRISVRRRLLPVQYMDEQKDSKINLQAGLLPSICAVLLIIIGCLGFYIIQSKRKRRRKNTVPATLQNMCNIEKPKVPLSRVRNLDASLLLAKALTGDNAEYLYPRDNPLLPSSVYEEIPDAQAMAAQNPVYMEDSSVVNQLTDMSRPENDYLEISGFEPVVNSGAYQSLLKKREPESLFESSSSSVNPNRLIN